MKRILPIIIAIICVIGIVFCCIMWYQSATNLPMELPNNESGENIIESGEDINQSRNQVVEEIISNEPIFDLDNYPRVDASLAIHPLVDSIASNFLGIPEEDLNYEYTKGRTSDVYKNLIDGSVDVIFAAEPSDDDRSYATSKGVELEVIPTTSSAFVFIVNTANPVDNLNLEEVVKIYKGDITNWNQVGGKDEEIIPYQRPNGSGSQTAMISLVMKDANLMTAPKMQVKGEMGGLVDAIAEYDNSEAAIGYSYFYYINTMYKRDTIKMIGIDGIKPTIETIKDGTYPVYTNGYIVFRKSEVEDSNVRKWVKTVLEKRGSKIIEDAGYVPIH